MKAKEKVTVSYKTRVNPDGSVDMWVPAVPGLSVHGRNHAHASLLLARAAQEFREMYDDLGWKVPEEFILG